MEEPIKFNKLVKIALEQYGISNFSSSFIRHNDNITLKIDNNEDNKTYVLRIHSPITSGLQGVQHAFEGLNAEMVLLNSLHEQTSLPLQKPVKNKKGNFVSTIVDVEKHFIPLATLLTWQEGKVYTGNEINSKDIAFEVGGILAKLHNFSKNWMIPQPFIRPHYDIEKYRNLTDRLQYGVEIDLITPEQYDVILDTMRSIRIIFDSNLKTKNSWGIIHADLQGSNIIVNNDTVSPIDFGFSGYGYYLFDIGITLTTFDITHREKVLEGYKVLRNLNEEDELLISAGFILAIFGAFGFNINNQNSHEWIQRRIPYVTQNYCRAFLEKKSFLFEIE